MNERKKVWRKKERKKERKKNSFQLFLLIELQIVLDVRPISEKSACYVDHKQPLRSVPKVQHDFILSSKVDIFYYEI